MDLHHIRLIGFAVGVLIVGLQTVLIAKQWRKAQGVEQRKVLECGLFLPHDGVVAIGEPGR